MKQTKFLSARSLIVLMTVLLTIFAFGVTALAADTPVTYNVTFQIPGESVPYMTTVSEGTALAEIANAADAPAAVRAYADYYWVDTQGDVVTAVGTADITVRPAMQISFYEELDSKTPLQKGVYAIETAFNAVAAFAADVPYDIVNGAWLAADQYIESENYYTALHDGTATALVDLFDGATNVTLYRTIGVRYFASDKTVVFEGIVPNNFKVYSITEINKFAGSYKTEDGYNAGWYAMEAGEDMYYPIYAVNTVAFKADTRLVAKLPFINGIGFAGDVTEPAVPNKVGYFGKWATYDFDEKEDFNVYAQYTAKTYYVSFNANGGEGSMSSQIHSYDGEKALSTNTFTREGYTFAGWNTKADGTGDSFADEESVTNISNTGITLYAQWTKNVVKVYKATFVADDSVVATISFEAGATELKGVPALPVKNGYTGAWEDFTLEDEDITIHATYTANNYEIRFDANSGVGTVANVTATYDTDVILPAGSFTREGYTFAGWNTKADGTGVSFEAGATVKNLTASGIITLYAEWEATAIVEDTTTAEETTTAPVVDDEKSNVGLIVGICVVAGLAVIGGVVGALVYNKKKKS